MAWLGVLLTLLTVATTVSRGSVWNNRVDDFGDGTEEDALLTASYNSATVTCETQKYPPASKSEPEEFIINLDLPPVERWQKLAVAKAAAMGALLESLKEWTGFIFHGEVVRLVDLYMPLLGKTLPAPYREEMRGISQAANITLGEVVLYNIFYEIFTVCTSVIAEGPDGKMYHGRNLDFGLFLGWDTKNATWLTTEFLRPLIVKLDFQRNGESVFKAVNFAGYVGILTGFKPNTFTLSMDERFTVHGGFIGVLKWILGSRSAHWMGFLTREVLETASSFKQAQSMLAKTKLLAPAYFILGGNKTGQGVIITRDQNKYDILNFGELSKGQSSTWYLVQTNYDHWKSPPFYDDRRTPAIKCLDKFGQGRMGFSSLFNVLSTRPVLNKLTTYTALMQVEGSFEVYLQECPDPCSPW